MTDGWVKLAWSLSPLLQGDVTFRSCIEVPSLFKQSLLRIKFLKAWRKSYINGKKKLKINPNEPPYHVFGSLQLFSTDQCIFLQIFLHLLQFRHLPRCVYSRKQVVQFDHFELYNKGLKERDTREDEKMDGLGVENQT